MKAKNEIGKKYGRWTVICQIDSPPNVKHNAKYWLCQCECGNFYRIRGDTFRRGQSTQCKQCAWDILKRGEKHGTF